MPELKCTVDSCLYNKRECCCKGDIKVDGEHAKRTEDTCCSSFKEQKGETYTSSTEQPSKTIKVACDATSCVYNTDCECTASSIGICGGNVCKCTDTECASFRCQ